jgi:hypothetical protein
MFENKETKRREGERGNSENVSLPLSAGAYNTVHITQYNLACDGYMESTFCCVRARFLGMETKKLFSLLWYIQRYLIMYVFKNLNLLLNKYVA